MCLEDYTIARQLRTRVYQTITTIGIPANPSRVALVITCDTTATASLFALYTTVNNVVASNGVYMGGSIGPATGPALPTVLRLEDYGDILKAEMSLQSTGGEGNVYLVETYLEIDTPYNPTLTKLPR